MQHEQLGLGTARPQARDGVGLAVELPGAHDEWQALAKSVSELRVEGQVVALPLRAAVVHDTTGENVGSPRRCSWFCWGAGQGSARR